MAGDTKTLKVVILGNAKSGVKAFAETEAAATGAGGKIEALGTRIAGFAKKAAIGLVGVQLGAAAVGVHSIHAAMDFQRSMQLINTQARIPQAVVDQLSKSVLSIARATATGPNQLAEALYHIESTGVPAAKAVRMLEIAAKGAKIGNADLVDVTNALNAAVASGIPGVQSLDQAMGSLNTTVGTGDMHMQDLAEAFGGGVLAVVKNYGLSMKDVGAALATFGDNNIRGADAATMLRMAVQALAVPASKGSDTIKKLGLNMHTLGDAMAKGGLPAAIDLLHSRLVATGLDGNKMGAALTDAFGKKAGPGLAVLLDQFERFHTKLRDQTKGANDFGAAWATTTHNFAFQWDKFKTSIDVLSIKLGTKLLPVATAFLQAIQTGASKVNSIAGDIKNGLTGSGGKSQSNGLAGRFSGMDKEAPKLGFLGDLAKKIHDGITTAVSDAAKGFDLGKILGNSVAGVGNFFVHLLEKLSGAAANVDWVGFGIKIGKYAVPLLVGFAAGLLNFDLGSLLSGMAKHWFDILMGLLAVVLMPEKWALKIAGMLAKVPFAGKLLEWLFLAVRDLGSKILKPVLDFFRFLGDAFIGGFRGEGPRVFKAIGDFFRSIGLHVGVWALDFFKWGKNLLERLILGMASKLESLGAFLGRVASWIVRGGAKLVDILTKPGRLLMSKFLDAIVSAGHAVAGWFGSMGKWILGHVGDLGHTLWDAGVKLIEGLIGGIGSKIGAVKDKLQGLTKRLTDWKGPAKTDATILFRSGQLVIEGFIRGLSSKYSTVKASLGGFTLSLLAPVAKNLSTQRVRSVMADVMASQNKRLSKLTSERMAIATKLAATQKALTAIQNAKANLTSNLSQNIAGFGQVSGLMDSTEGADNSATGIAGRMSNMLGTIRSFVADLSALKSAGFSGSIVEQIAGMAPDAGDEMAKSLLKATTGQVAQMNDAQSQIASLANAGASGVANSLYGTGESAAQGVIDGLTKKQAGIDKAIKSLSMRMVKTIRGDLEAILHEPLAKKAAVHHGTHSSGHTVNVTIHVAGNVTAEKNLAKSIADSVRTELLKTANRNGGRTGITK